MDEAETKTCPNCKREIPAVNFTIHSVHCARNIKMCPVCKEPVPLADILVHHEALHALLPCDKCGESVCGTDLEDHIRDSCAHTIKSCRFCELELPRREIPAHENYCGVRTEQCPECQEWVMIKYRQLHVDSNHGFIRLDDDGNIEEEDEEEAGAWAAAFLSQPKPEPQARREAPKSTRIPKPINNPPPPAGNAFSNLSFPANGLRNINYERPRTVIRRIRPSSSAEPIAGGSRDEGAAGGPEREAQRLPMKRTNDQPQININNVAADKVNKDLPMSRGAVKKRPAPRPPRAAPRPDPRPDPRRDLPYYSAVQRQQDEERQRLEQTAINLARGLPPVLSPLEKLERLRKLDALHNRETEPQPQAPRAAPGPSRPTGGPAPGGPRHQPSPADRDREERRNEFSNFQPMSPQEFMRRFNAMQLDRGDNQPSRYEEEQRQDYERAGWYDGPGERAGRRDEGQRRQNGGNDRFSEIKSSLQELRRGLNEVTAPYNSNALNNELAQERSNRARDDSPSSGSEGEGRVEDVELPCEFCGRPVPLEDLVRHQTGCRPDLAQLKARERLRHTRQHEARLAELRRREAELTPAPLLAALAMAEADRADYEMGDVGDMREDEEDPPVIPCEFCTESLPVYLISDHQERCRREGPMLYPD